MLLDMVLIGNDMLSRESDNENLGSSASQNDGLFAASLASDTRKWLKLHTIEIVVQLMQRSHRLTHCDILYKAGH